MYRRKKKKYIIKVTPSSPPRLKQKKKMQNPPRLKQLQRSERPPSSLQSRTSVLLLVFFFSWAAGSLSVLLVSWAACDLRDFRASFALIYAIIFALRANRCVANVTRRECRYGTGTVARPAFFIRNRTHTCAQKELTIEREHIN